MPVILRFLANLLQYKTALPSQATLFCKTESNHFTIRALCQTPRRNFKFDAAAPCAFTGGCACGVFAKYRFAMSRQTSAANQGNRTNVYANSWQQICPPFVNLSECVHDIQITGDGASSCRMEFAEMENNGGLPTSRGDKNGSESLMECCFSWEVAFCLCWITHNSFVIDPFLAEAGTRILPAHCLLILHSQRDASNRHVLTLMIIHPCLLRHKMLRIAKRHKLVHPQILLTNRPVKTLNIRILLRIARLDVHFSSIPCADAHARTSRLTNSGPLSNRIDFGLPRHATSCSKAYTTRRAGKEKATSMQTHSRMASSTTYKIRIVRPYAI